MRYGWTRHAPLVTMTTLTLLVLAMVHFNRDGPPPDDSEQTSLPTLAVPSQPTVPDAEAAVAEIAQIREQVGENLLAGTSLAVPNGRSEGRFARALRAEAGLTGVAETPLLTSLRDAARLLGQQAEQLEGDSRYKEADRLRDLADRIRQEARLLGGVVEPATASP